MPTGVYERPTAESRFWASVEKTETCWNWTGRRGGSEGRYGSMSINYRATYVHRFSYELHIGPIPEGLTIDHLCRNTLCVNPDHLEPVTLRENLRRAAIVQPCPECGREMLPRIVARHLPVCRGEVTTCSKGHAYTEANTRYWRGNRYCRRCHADRAAKYRRQTRERAA